jgi:hypothetical protein
MIFKTVDEDGAEIELEGNSDHEALDALSNLVSGTDGNIFDCFQETPFLGHGEDIQRILILSPIANTDGCFTALAVVQEYGNPIEYPLSSVELCPKKGFRLGEEGADCPPLPEDIIYYESEHLMENGKLLHYIAFLWWCLRRLDFSDENVAKVMKLFESGMDIIDTDHMPASWYADRSQSIADYTARTLNDSSSFWTECLAFMKVLLHDAFPRQPKYF